MTENTTDLERQAPERTLLVPITGESVDLDASPPILLRAMDELEELRGDLIDVITAIERELIRRADATGKRTVELSPGLKVETNAPTVPEYDVDELRRRLGPLVRAGTVDRATYDALIVQPERPPLPPQRVDGNVAKGLLTSDNEELVEAVRAATTRRPVGRRTLKVKSRPVEATVEETD